MSALAGGACPPWCGGCQTYDRTGEVVHEVELFALALTLYPPTVAPRLRGAVVAVVRIDEFGPDGSLVAWSAPPGVVLDSDQGVISMTPQEAARLGAALIRAARTAR